MVSNFIFNRVDPIYHPHPLDMTSICVCSLFVFMFLRVFFLLIFGVKNLHISHEVLQSFAMLFRLVNFTYCKVCNYYKGIGVANGVAGEAAAAPIIRLLSYFEMLKNSPPQRHFHCTVFEPSAPNLSQPRC